MKTNYLWFILLGITVACNQNDNFTVLTRVNPDGTIYREFTALGDSAFMVGEARKTPFPILIDSLWEITYFYGADSLPKIYKKGWPVKSWKFKTDSIHSIWVKASHTFKSVNDLNQNFSFNNIPWNLPIKQEFRLDQSFCWFYTKYNYTETFKRLIASPKVKISDYLNDEELSQLFGENASYTNGRNGEEVIHYLKDLEEKAGKWQNKSIFEAFYAVIDSNLEKIQSPNCKHEWFLSVKDSIFNMLSNDITDNDTSLFNKLDTYFGTKGFSGFYNLSDSVSKIFKNAGEAVMAYYPGSLNYHLILPGKTCCTNAHKIMGDTLFWKINSERFLFSDYQVKAESKVLHYWAIIISIVIFGIVVIFAGYRMRKA